MEWSREGSSDVPAELRAARIHGVSAAGDPRHRLDRGAVAPASGAPARTQATPADRSHRGDKVNQDSATDVLLEVRDVSHSFGGVRAVNHASAAAPRALSPGIIGPKGP